MRFNVLGPVSVTHGEQSLDVGGPKQRTVLAMLVAHVGERVSADVIVEAVYGEGATPNARRIVQTYISALRAELDDLIEKEKGGWRLQADQDQVDALEAARLIESANAIVESSPERANALLRDGLALWRGHPYADIDAHGLLDGEVVRLNELRAVAQASRIDTDLALGRHAELIGEIEAIIVENPYRERFRAQHMVALYRSGRQREALKSYEQLRTTLQEELGLDPSPDLQELETRILNQDPALLEVSTGRVEKRAVLVVDPGDSLELARPGAGQTAATLAAIDRVFNRALDGNPGTVFVAGTASYGVVESVDRAVELADTLMAATKPDGPRVAIDWGDIERVDEAVSGPPITRVAKLVSLAHAGQILLSLQAQREVVETGRAGLKFEALGSIELPGLEGPTQVYQLLSENSTVRADGFAAGRLPPPLPGIGTGSIPGYELREPVGVGSAGDLYLGYQPSMGREVLVEVIPKTVASDVEFVRRFETDVQRLSLFDHPNIARILDYWRDPGGAYIVYPSHRGGPLNVERVPAPARLVAQVGSALSHAHSYGMVHGGLEPGKVLLDESGDAHLLGFQIAGLAPKRSREYPQYVAEEILDGASPTPESDLYSLAVLTQEVLTGQSTEATVTPVSEVVARSLDTSPSRRHASVSEFLIELNPEDLDAPASRFTVTRNPFKGLGVFEEFDAGDFHGRETVVTQIIEDLRRERFLALVGPSGIGKSSVVRAGVIPAVRGGALGSEPWHVAVITPGRDPFLELRHGLQRVAAEIPAELSTSLAESRPNALAQVSDALPGGGRLLVIVDQFEELFTLSEAASRAEFADLLATATGEGHAHFLLTLRADFLDRPLAQSVFADLFEGRTLTLGSMTPAELASAIRDPARGVGVEVEGALVERMMGEVHDRPGALPLLQLAMTELFEERDSDLLSVENYEAMGGVSGALARQAESVYGVLSEAQQETARQLFLRLVAVSELGPTSRRRTRMTELEDLGRDDVVEAFSRARLLVLDTDVEARMPTVEVAHEAILEHWPRLADWVESAREDLILAKRLDEAVAEWDRNNRSEGYLLTGPRLARHQSWASETDLALSPIQQEYLRESRARDEHLTRRRRRTRRMVMSGFGVAALISLVFGLVALRNANEAQQSEQRASENELLALQNESRAEESAREAEDNARAAEAEALAQAATATMTTDPELSLLLALQAISVDPTPTAEPVIHQALQEHRAIFRQSLGEEAEVGGSMSPDGRLLVMTDSADQLEVWDIDDDSGPIWTLTPPSGLQLEAPAFTVDSERLVVPVAVATIGLVDPQRANRFTPPEPRVQWPEGTGFHVHDARTGELLDVVPLPSCYFSLAGFPLTTDGARILMRAGIPDGDECGFTNGNFLELGHFDLHESTFDTYGIVSSQAPPGWVTQSLDGRYISFAEENVHKLIDSTSGGLIYEKESFSGAAPIVSNDGTRIIESRAEGTSVRLVDVATGELLNTFAPGSGQLVFSADDSLVAGGDSGDGMVYVWETESGRLLHRLRTSGTDQRLIHISGDSNRVAAFGSLGIVHDIGTEMVSEDSGFEFPSLEDGFIPRTPRGLDVSQDLIVYSAVPGGQPDSWKPEYLTIKLLDMSDGIVRFEWLGSLPVLSSDGDLVASQPYLGMVDNEDLAKPLRRLGPVEIREAQRGSRVSVGEGMCSHVGWPETDLPGDDCEGDLLYEWPTSMQFSPDGKTLAMIGPIGDRLMVWEVPSGDLLWNKESGLEPGPRLLQFSPDSRTIVLMDDEVATVLDAMDGTMAGAFDVENESFGMAFAPDGSTLYVGDLNANVLVFETEGWSRVGVLEGQGGAALSDIALNPSGRLLATAGNDGDMWLWDVEQERVILQLPLSDGRLQNVEWLGEDRLLVGSTTEVIIMTFDIDELTAITRSRLTRSFLPEECSTYSIDPCPSLEEIKATP